MWGKYKHTISKLTLCKTTLCKELLYLEIGHFNLFGKKILQCLNNHLLLYNALKTLEIRGLVRIFWKIPKIPHLLTIFSQCVFLKFTNVCQKTQKSPLLFTIGTKLGRQKATLSRWNVPQPITDQRNDVSTSLAPDWLTRTWTKSKCKQRFDDLKKSKKSDRNSWNLD